MRFASSLSTHPHAPTAAGEIVGELLDTLGDSPDAALVLVAGSHAGLLAPICSAIRDLADIGVTVGTSASAVIGNGRVVENTPAISVWAAITSAATPFHLSLEPTGAPGGERAMRGVESVQLEHADAAFVLAAPGFALEPAVSALHARHSHLRIAGGTISAGAVQTTQMWVDGRLHHDGAVGLLLGAQDDHVPTAATAHGASPVGQAMVVTSSVGRTVRALAGARATDALDRLVLGPTELLGPQWEGADPDTIRRHLRIGVVLEEHDEDYVGADFVLSRVVEADRLQGTIQTDRDIAVGTAVQFHLMPRDPAFTALTAAAVACRASTALVAAAPGRHDLSELAEVGVDAMAGVVCTSQVGPAGRRLGRPHLHTEADTALFI